MHTPLLSTTQTVTPDAGTASALGIAKPSRDTAANAALFETLSSDLTDALSAEGEPTVDTPSVKLALSATRVPDGTRVTSAELLPLPLEAVGRLSPIAPADPITLPAPPTTNAAAKIAALSAGPGLPNGQLVLPAVTANPAPAAEASLATTTATATADAPPAANLPSIVAAPPAKANSLQAPNAATGGADAIVQASTPLGTPTNEATVFSTPTTPLVAQAAESARSAPTLAPLPTDPAAQVADAIRVRANERSVTVRLDPPELGTVRIEFAFDRGAVTAIVATDQPSTGDLLRRHSDWLHQAMAEAGIDGAQIEWGEANDPNEREGWQQLQLGTGAPNESASATSPQTQLTALSGGIDLRL